MAKQRTQKQNVSSKVLLPVVWTELWNCVRLDNLKMWLLLSHAFTCGCFIHLASIKDNQYFIDRYYHFAPFREKFLHTIVPATQAQLGYYVRMSIWMCLNSFHINQHLRFYFQKRFNVRFASPCLHGECIWINLSWLESHVVLRDRGVIYRNKLRTVLWVCGSDFQKLHWHRSSASATRLVFGNLFLPTYVAIFGKFLSSFSTFHTNISVESWDCKP